MASQGAVPTSSNLLAVLSAVARTAARLCDARDAQISLVEGDHLRHVAHYGSIFTGRTLGDTYPVAPTTPIGHAVRERRIIHIRDMARAIRTRYPEMTIIRGRSGSRTVLAVPMLRDGVPVGGIVIRRRVVRPFTTKQITLLKTFADQAALAIENARLSEQLQAQNRALTAALEQQTATSEILRAISSSPAELQPVMAAVAENAARVCGANDAMILRLEGEVLNPAAVFGRIPGVPVPVSRQTPAGRSVIERKTLHIHDIAAVAATEYPESPATARGVRTLLATPLLSQGVAIGAIAIRRMEVNPFTDQQVALLQTFADQAVIAIENVRMFTELQGRNRDLTEALEQQTATGEILRAISGSPTDAQPVFEAIVQSAVRLCNARFANVFRLEGDVVHLAAHHNLPLEALDQFQRTFPQPLSQGGTLTAQAMRRGSVVHVHDIDREPDVAAPVRALSRSAGYRSALAVPILRQGSVVGAIGVGRSDATGAPWPFSDKEVALLQTFADQAVIAIENVRLFRELQTRNRDLSEALDQQTATGEILRVISSSPTDVQPVLDVVAESAARLCGAADALVARVDGGMMHRVAHFGEIVSVSEARPVAPDTPTGRAIVERRAIHVDDIVAELARGDYLGSRGLQEATGFRTVLAVPLIREDEVIGAITMRRLEVRPFTGTQIALVQTFADQAVIAIENVRLFTELQARTAQLTRSVEQLTALGEVGRALGSTLDLETILQTIVDRANQLAGTDACSVFEYDEAAEEFRLHATHNLDEQVIAVARRTPIRKGEGVQGRMAITRAPVQIPDIAAGDAYRGPLRDVLVRAGTRAVLAIPLLGEDRLVGSLTVAKKTPGPFPADVIGLLQTFATQSALAIQNARLFREIEEQSRQLEAASRHKSQFLANMSHELRTPLNAILGYTELIGDNIYGEVPDKMREVLERVEKSGRHLLGLINDILDLSKIEAGQLTLALNEYALQDVIRSVAAATEPLARGKGLGLQVTVPDDLPIGRADERRLMQVLLNLVGNAIKFTEAGKVAIQADVAGDRFEVAVADTGPGIAEGDREKIFEEFQQADSAVARAKGGTGLGLAIARRIIEMHGGRLWLESTLGVGSTFSFTVPVRVEQQVVVTSRRPAS